MNAFGQSASTSTADLAPQHVWFVGSIWREDFYAQEHRHCDGKTVTVHYLCTTDSGDGARKLMKMMAGLAHDDTCQLCSNSHLWVCGVRAQRSKFVRLYDWAERCYRPEGNFVMKEAA